MKPIAVQPQVSLGPARALQLAAQGMTYRFFRSGVTVAILSLAVAFLAHTLVYGLLSRSSAGAAYREFGDRRALGFLANRLLRPDGDAAILDGLAEGDAGRLAEYTRWGGLSDAEAAQATGAARDIREAAHRFAAMPEDRRAILLGDGDMTALLGRLQAPGQLDLFRSRLKQLMPGRSADTERDIGRLATEAWPRLEETVGRVRAGQAAAIAAVRSAYPGRELLDMLIAPPPGFFETVKQAGFRLADVNVGALAGFASLAADRASVESALGDATVRAGLAQRIRSGAAAFSTDEVFRWLLGRSGDAAWLAGALAGTGVRIPAARLAELAAYYDRFDRLQQVADESAVAGSTVLPPEGGTGGLLLLAFFVCVVGVANAMLMSVTERFTEIATMKCIGALDGFVMLMFVFEAAIQGLIGGIVGVVLGALLAFGRGVFEFGSLLAAGPPVPARIVLALAASLLTGVVLAVVAAIGPSLVAARLAPMEAMRVE